MSKSAAKHDYENKPKEDNVTMDKSAKQQHLLLNPAPENADSGTRPESAPGVKPVLGITAMIRKEKEKEKDKVKVEAPVQKGKEKAKAKAKVKEKAEEEAQLDPTRRREQEQNPEAHHPLDKRTDHHVNFTSVVDATKAKSATIGTFPSALSIRKEDVVLERNVSFSMSILLLQLVAIPSLRRKPKLLPKKVVQPYNCRQTPKAARKRKTNKEK